MADDKLLDALHKTREMLIQSIERISQRMNRLTINGILFLLILSALVFNENFKPSNWEIVSQEFEKWNNDYPNQHHLGNINYRNFLSNNIDKRFFGLRDTILKSIEENYKKNTTNHQKRMLQVLEDISIMDGINLLEIGSLRQSLDSVKQIITNNSSLKEEKGIDNNIIKENNQKANEIFTSLRKKYPIINLELKISNIDTIYTEILSTNLDKIGKSLDGIEKKNTVKSWIEIQKNYSHALDWNYGAWEVLNDTNLVKTWTKIFDILNYADNLSLNKEIRQDSSFSFNWSTIKNYVESEKKIQSQIPTTEIFATKIPLPTQLLVLIMPLLFTTGIIILRILGFQRKTYEIRMIMIEKKLKEELNNEDLVRSNMFSEETRNLISRKYVNQKEFYKLYRNNPKVFKDIFYYLLAFFLFGYLIYKWLFIVWYDGMAKIGAVVIILLIFVIIKIFIPVHKKVRKYTLADLTQKR